MEEDPDPDVTTSRNDDDNGVAEKTPDDTDAAVVEAENVLRCN